MPANYRELDVWQKSMRLVAEIYRLFDSMPNCEKYALVDQMRRAAISVPSNIAEGQGRGTDKERLRFLYIARGSLCELQTQLDLCAMLNYFTADTLKDINLLTVDVSKMLNGFIKKIIADAGKG